VPYVLAMASVRLAQLTSRLIFRGKGKLPSLLVPCRFEARFKPLWFSNHKAREGLGWRPALSYEEALRRTYGAPDPVAAPAPEPQSESEPESAVVTTHE
jgi:hypothetical protein